MVTPAAVSPAAVQAATPSNSAAAVPRTKPAANRRATRATPAGYGPSCPALRVPLTISAVPTATHVVPITRDQGVPDRPDSAVPAATTPPSSRAVPRARAAARPAAPLQGRLSGTGRRGSPAMPKNTVNNKENRHPPSRSGTQPSVTEPKRKPNRKSSAQAKPAHSSALTDTVTSS